MSIATMNWALSQRLETHQQQILLYVIADSADPAGVTRHCDPDYMAERARLSRATTYRRLGELEELGVLSRFKFYSEHGAPIYEIRLNLAAQIDLAIRTRRKGDDDEDGPDAPEPATPESQAETLVERPQSHSRETGAVAPVRQAQSHSCDNIGPPVSKNLPPNPPPGGSLPKSEVEGTAKRLALWDRFVASYPGIGPMDQTAAREELDALSVDDAEWAISVLPQLKEDLRKANNRPPKNAHLWLRKGMFRNYPKAKIEPPPPDEVWIVDGSDEDRSLRFVRSLAKAVSPMVRSNATGQRGYPHRCAVGADMLAMLAFVNDVTLRWKPYALGSPEATAWQARFQAWTGRGLPVEPGGNQIRAPCPWPPKKDGTLYQDDQGEGEST